MSSCFGRSESAASHKPIVRLAHILLLASGWAAIASLSACSGPVKVSGRVVDQHGDPVRDVRISLTAAAANRYESDAYAGESSVVSPDGRFDLDCGFCSAVHVFFSKEGYYSQSLDLAFYQRSRGLEVLLRRSEAPVGLIRLEGRIEAGPGFDDLVLRIDPEPPQVRPVSEVEREAVIPARTFVTLRPTLADDGSIARQADGSRELLAPLVLDFGMARGGIVLHDGVEAKTLREGFYEMPVAPDVDYPSSVVIDPADGDRYFFCRIAGQYCKGFIHAPFLNQSRDGATAAAVIELWLNPYFGNRSLDDPTTY